MISILELILKKKTAAPAQRISGKQANDALASALKSLTDAIAEQNQKGSPCQPK